MDTLRFFENPYTDGSVLDLEGLVVKSRRALSKFITEIEEHYQRVPSNDGSVYTGLGGLAYMYWHLWKRTKNEGHMKRAVYWIHKARTCHFNSQAVSFLLSLNGVLALEAVITGNWNDTLLDVDAAATRHAEVLYGLAGYLYTLHLLSVYFPSQSESIHKKIADVEGELHTRVDIVEGVPTWEWHGKCYLGAARGSLGIAYMLKNTPYMNLLRGGIQSCENVPSSL